jgi:hypothetical protein
MDTTICYNTSCPSAPSCSVYTRPAGEWQNFTHFTPNDTTGRCVHYEAVEGVSEKKGEGEE